MLRESYRLIRALPCLKNNRERLPVTKLLGNSKSFCFYKKAGENTYMDITDIQSCADFFQDNYLKTFYLVITYNGSSYILIGEKTNFPHLMGIQNSTYRSNGYNQPQYLFFQLKSILPEMFKIALDQRRLFPVMIIVNSHQTLYLCQCAGWACKYFCMFCFQTFCRTCHRDLGKNDLVISLI